MKNKGEYKFIEDTFEDESRPDLPVNFFTLRKKEMETFEGLKIYSYTHCKLYNSKSEVGVFYKSISNIL